MSSTSFPETDRFPVPSINCSLPFISSTRMFSRTSSPLIFFLLLNNNVFFEFIKLLHTAINNELKQILKRPVVSSIEQKGLSPIWLIHSGIFLEQRSTTLLWTRDTDTFIMKLSYSDLHETNILFLIKLSKSLPSPTLRCKHRFYMIFFLYTPNSKRNNLPSSMKRWVQRGGEGE